MSAFYLPLALSNPELLAPLTAVASAVALAWLVVVILNRLGGHH